MIKNDIRKDSLFNELSPFAEAMDMALVDVHRNVKGPTEVQVQIVVMMKEGDTSVDQLASFHRAVQPRLELEIGREILSMEVSSPGLQRSFKDFHEFHVFLGRRCRLYSLSKSSWVEGDISLVTDDSVQLTDVLVIDTNESLASAVYPISDIQKAKLEYKWETKKENKKSGDNKNV